jgi:hypothetical protein
MLSPVELGNLSIHVRFWLKRTNGVRIILILSLFVYYVSFSVFACTLKPQYNDPFNNKVPAIKNLIVNPFVVNSIVKSPSTNKIPAIKNKIFGPFRFVILRFPCSLKTRGSPNP